MNHGIIISSFEHKNKAAIATNNNAVVDVDVCKKKKQLWSDESSEKNAKRLRNEGPSQNESDIENNDNFRSGYVKVWLRKDIRSP